METIFDFLKFDKTLRLCLNRFLKIRNHLELIKYNDFQKFSVYCNYTYNLLIVTNEKGPKVRYNTISNFKKYSVWTTL